MSADPCLSQSSVSSDGKWEGWCWYPDRPQERAVVEVFVGARSVRAVRAARLRTDIRDLGMGDGYCGFQLPLPSKESLSGYAIVEVRERRFGRVIGRVVIGEDGSQTTVGLRLKLAGESLQKADVASATAQVRLRRRSAPLEELGAVLSRLARTSHHHKFCARAAVLAACEERIAAVPHTELGWSQAPRLSLVVPASYGGASVDLVTLANALREVAYAMRHIGMEIILVCDARDALARLLSSRLRHLRVVCTPASCPPGVGLNAAALDARGSWLGFSRPHALGAANLAEIVALAADDTVYVAASSAALQPFGGQRPLQALVQRRAFHTMGGFDPGLEEPGLWTDLAHRARLVEQRIVSWGPPGGGRSSSGVAAHHQDT